MGGFIKAHVCLELGTCLEKTGEDPKLTDWADP